MERTHFKATGKGIFLFHYWPFVGAVVLTLVLSGNAVILQLNQWPTSSWISSGPWG